MFVLATLIIKLRISLVGGRRKRVVEQEKLNIIDQRIKWLENGWDIYINFYVSNCSNSALFNSTVKAKKVKKRKLVEDVGGDDASLLR